MSSLSLCNIQDKLCKLKILQVSSQGLSSKNTQTVENFRSREDRLSCIDFFFTWMARIRNLFFFTRPIQKFFHHIRALNFKENVQYFTHRYTKRVHVTARMETQRSTTWPRKLIFSLTVWYSLSWIHVHESLDFLYKISNFMARVNLGKSLVSLIKNFTLWAYISFWGTELVILNLSFPKMGEFRCDIPK